MGVRRLGDSRAFFVSGNTSPPDEDRERNRAYVLILCHEIALTSSKFTLAVTLRPFWTATLEILNSSPLLESPFVVYENCVSAGMYSIQERRLRGINYSFILIADMISESESVHSCKDRTACAPEVDDGIHQYRYRP